MKKIKEIVKITWEVGTGICIIPVFLLVGVGAALFIWGKAIHEIITEGPSSDCFYCFCCKREGLTPEADLCNCKDRK
jgi:hypothetical protein